METLSNIQKTLSTVNTINEFMSISSPRFVTFTYRTKGTKELSKYTILVGCNYKNHVRKDLEKLTKYFPISSEESVLREDILKSLTETLVLGVSSKYTKKGYYNSLSDNGTLKESNELGKIYLNGYFISKKVIEVGENTKKKSVSVRELLKRKCNFSTTKFREFVLDTNNIKGISINKKTMEIYTSF